MDKIGTSMRSKMPPLGPGNMTQNEGTILLSQIPSSQHKQNANYNTNASFNINNINNSNQVSSNCDEGQQIDTISQLSSDNDLYDYNDKSNANRINEWQAGYNVTNAIQGMFVVSLPFAVASGGYWALLAMLLVAYVCCYTGKILIDCLYDDDNDEVIDIFNGRIAPITMSKCKRRHRVRTSYVDIAKDVWGSFLGAHIVNIAQNIELLMTCILYLVLCGDLFVGSFPDSPLDHSSWTIISCMMLIPCAFIRSLKFVSRLSLCNAIVHVVINLIIVLYCLTQIKDWDFNKVEIKINIWSFPVSLGIIVFSYTSQIFLPTMEGNMIDRTKFDSMLHVSHIIAAIFKALFGLLGFLTWQENTDEVITNNLPTRNLKILVNMILVVKALLSYPLPYFASVELLESSLFLNSNTSLEPTEFINNESRKRRKSSIPSKPVFMRTCYDLDGDLTFWAVCLRIGLILFTLFLAIFIPHFAILMGLIGSITGTMLSLIWPCYFHLKLKAKTLKWYQKAIDFIIITFGLLITVTGVYYSSIALIKALKNEDAFPNNYYKKNTFFGKVNTNKTLNIFMNMNTSQSFFP